MDIQRENDPQAASLREERQAALGLLRSTFLGVSPWDLAEKLTILAAAYSECEAVAIRLRKGPDYPYAASRGFGEDFIRMEDSLCALDNQGVVLRNERRQPVLECMCGGVLSGQTDLARPYFTPAGSFFTQSTTELLEEAVDHDRRVRTRNRCHQSGYESVGLFPIRLGENMFGLIQCNDRRMDRFPPEKVELLEELATTAAHLFQLSML